MNDSKHPSLNRRELLGVLTAALTGLPPLSARAAGVPLRVLTAQGDSSSSPLYGVDRGFFSKAGLDVNLTVLANGGVTVPAVVGGSAEIAGTSVTNLALAHLKGVPLAGIAPTALYNDRAPTSELLVAKDSPLKTAADLTGKTVAVNGLNTNSHIATMAWIDKNGGNSKAVKYVEFVYSAMIPALTEGHIDAALFIEPTLTIAKKSARVFALPYNAIAPHFYLGIYVARRDWLSENADVAKRFVRSLGETARWANKHQPESLEILARSLKVDPSTFNGMTRAVFADSLDPREVQPVIDVSVRYGALSASFPAKEILWP